MTVPKIDALKWFPLLAIIIQAIPSTSFATELIGQVIAQNPVNVVSEVKGVVEQTTWQVGDKLIKGERLATIKVQDFELAVRKQQANVALITADLQLKRSIHIRYQKLSIKNSLSQHELEIAKANLDAAKANLELANVDLKKARLDLKNTHITANIDGYIVSRAIDNGTWVNQGELLYQLINIDRVNIRLLASEFDLKDLAIGQTIQVWSEANPENKIIASINRIGVNLDASTLAYPIEIDIDNTKHLFKPGMSVHATTHIQSKQ